MNGTVLNPRAAVLLIGALATGGCDMLAGPEAASQVIGIIAWESASMTAAAELETFTPLAAPDTVLAGVPFTATVTTVGMASCWAPSGAVLGGSAGALVVTPIDLVPTTERGAPRPCPGGPVMLPRTVQLVIPRAGTTTLEVHGRRVVGGDLAGAANVVVKTLIYAH